MIIFCSGWACCGSTFCRNAYKEHVACTLRIGAFSVHHARPCCCNVKPSLKATFLTKVSLTHSYCIMGNFHKGFAVALHRMSFELCKFQPLMNSSSFV